METWSRILTKVIASAHARKCHQMVITFALPRQHFVVYIQFIKHVLKYNIHLRHHLNWWSDQIALITAIKCNHYTAFCNLWLLHVMQLRNHLVHWLCFCYGTTAKWVNKLWLMCVVLCAIAKSHETIKSITKNHISGAIIHRIQWIPTKNKKVQIKYLISWFNAKVAPLFTNFV